MGETALIDMAGGIAMTEIGAAAGVSATMNRQEMVVVSVIEVGVQILVGV